jgi:hypothetical protein
MEWQPGDDVAIELRRGVVSIPRSSHDALLEQLGNLETAADLRVAFQAGGPTGPVRLTEPQKLGLRNAITFWANQRGGSYDELPEGLYALRNALQDDLLDVGVEPSPD